MARKPTANKTGVAIEMFGMDDFLRQLRKAPKETRKAVSHANREIAKTVLVRMKQRSRTVFHASQYQTIVKSLKLLSALFLKSKRVSENHRRTRE
jgi:hypothetical protein